MASTPLSHLIWCLLIGLTVLRNLKVSCDHINGCSLEEPQYLWSWVSSSGYGWWRWICLLGPPEVQWSGGRQPAFVLRSLQFSAPKLVYLEFGLGWCLFRDYSWSSEVSWYGSNCGIVDEVARLQQRGNLPTYLLPEGTPEFSAGRWMYTWILVAWLTYLPKIVWDVELGWVYMADIVGCGYDSCI